MGYIEKDLTFQERQRKWKLERLTEKENEKKKKSEVRKQDDMKRV